MRNRALLILGIAVASLAVASLAEARFEWRDVEQTVEIQADGSIIVDDVRTLWTDEDFGEAFLCVQHGPDIDITLLEGSGAVSSGPGARAYTQACESGAAGTEMVIEQDRLTSERRVRFHYRLDGALQVHQDVVQWYWQIYGTENPTLTGGYRLVVTTPAPADEPYDAFVHRFDNPEEPIVELSDARDRLEVRFKRIPAGNGVEIRYLMPPEPFDLQGEGQRLAELLRDESRLAQAPQSPGISQQDRLLTERANIEENYYGLWVYPSGPQGTRADGTMSIRGTIPKRFPNPEAEFHATLTCATGEWESRPRPAFDSSLPRGDFDRFIAETEAEVSGPEFRLKDILVTCSEDNTQTIQANNLRRSLALIDPTYRPFGGFTAAQHIGIAVGSIANGGALWIGDDGWLEVDDRISIAAADVGDGEGLQRLSFDGVSQRLRFDPATPFEVYLRPGGRWQHFTFDVEGGRVTWRRAAPPTE